MKEFKTERVQKLIANAGVCSRREAEKLIEDGKVRVNGKTIELGSKAHQSDAIFVNNKPLQFSQERPTTLVLNKPKGFICSNKDPYATQTVFDLLPSDLQKKRLFCAGRLDKDSEGLLILTNDGDLANQLTHPSTNIVKRYRVTLSRDLNHKDIPKMLEGIDFEGEFLKADKIIPAPGEKEGNKRRLEVHLSHGKKREIRRLFEAHRYFVKKLVRFQIGNLQLRNIKKGGIKLLGQKDIARLIS
jgi:23S rRNA pseudouridine2605 synthase